MVRFQTQLNLQFVPLVIAATITTSLLSYFLARHQIDTAFASRLADSLNGLELEYAEIGDRMADGARNLNATQLVAALERPELRSGVDVLRSIAESMHLDVAQMFDAEGRVAATANRVGRIGQLGTIEPEATAALAGVPGRTFGNYPEGVAIFVYEPLRAHGRVIGAVCLGKTIDHEFLVRLHRKTGLQVTLYAGDHLQATTLPALSAADLATLDALRRGAPDGGGRHEAQATLGGEPTQALASRFAGRVQAVGGTMIVTISKADVVAATERMVALLMGVGGAVLLVLAFFCALLARRVVRPIEQLATAARQFGRGGQPRIELATGDELQALGEAFNSMIVDLRASTTSIENLHREVAERTAAEAALAAERERLVVTLRSIGDGVITTDTAGRVELINKAAEQLTGWSQAEAVGRPLLEVFDIVDAFTGAPRPNPVDRVLAHGQIIRLANHTDLRTRDGRSIPIADSGSPIFNRDSEIVGAVLVFRDVSEDYKRDEERLRMKKLESVGILAGGIAHDFNNILLAIAGNLSVAVERCGKDPELRSLLDGAARASNRARSLTTQLLTFAKGGAPIREVSSLPELIVDSTEFILRGSNVRSEYDFAPGLRPAQVDRGQMSQVVQNIVLNARQAMADGGVVHVSCENHQETTSEGTCDYVRIAITDRGGGIPPDVVERIFDPYFTTKDEGSGLGLAICHSIVARHDGRLTVATEAGVGTTFVVLLPASSDTPTHATDRSPGGGTGGEKSTGRGLVMDDDEMVSKATRRMLESLGYQIEVAADGAAALASYARSLRDGQRFDFVLMDLTIRGGMGGSDAVRALLELDPQACAIVTSGYSNDPVMASCREHGFRAAITKPFQVGEIRRVVEAALRSDG